MSNSTSPYESLTDETNLRIRDRMRDVLEADTQLRQQFFDKYQTPRQLHRLETNTVPMTQSPRAALTYAGDILEMPTTGMYQYNRMGVLLLTVQYFFDTQKIGQSKDAEEDAYDSCLTLTAQFQRAIMRNQADSRNPGLWNQLTWLQQGGRTATYTANSNEWKSQTYFMLSGYRFPTATAGYQG